MFQQWSGYLKVKIEPQHGLLEQDWTASILSGHEIYDHGQELPSPLFLSATFH